MYVLAIKGTSQTTKIMILDEKYTQGQKSLIWVQHTSLIFIHNTYKLCIGIIKEGVENVGTPTPSHSCGWDNVNKIGSKPS